ncbi:MAG: carbohydrate-binding domain-containing protein [Xenococcus sp. (in: cyanobacteria)]
MDNIPTSIDITNLPDEILTAVPGISNAVANDKRDDAATLQAVIDWLTNLRAEGFTDAIEIYIPAGVFDFAKTLDINVPNITIRGDGMGLTIVQNSDAFLVGTGNLTDQGIDVNSINRKAYLFDLDKDADNVTFTNITFTGSEIHGAIFAFGADALEIKQSEFNDFAFSSLRPFNISEIKVHDNIFIDAGNRTSQVIGGAIYGTFLGGAEIYNNSIFKTETYEGNFFGIKGRQFKNSLIYNNTIETDFAIELPFENDENVEIYHNFLDGTVSIPKYQGGPVPENGFTFRIHHNYFTKSYSIEVPRNGIEIDHNVFSFDPEQDDTGNLISNFNQDSEPVNGPIVFHNNLILNPGRGIFWSQGPYNNFSFYNNEVIARDTVNFRTEGLFGFNGGTDFSTIEIRDNIIEINGMARPLLRNATGVNAKISNNTLSNISDVAQYANPNTGAQRGLIDSLLFQVGVNGEFNVDGANLSLINGSGSSSINLTADSTSISEKDGIAVVTVNREAGTTGELTVTLLNSDPTAVTVATEVTIPDGEAATSFFIFGVDNTTSDGRRTATIRASVAGLVVDTITFNINDDEPPIATIFKIEAEDYSADYFDTSAGNSGGTSGFTDDVDVSVNPAGGFYVSHIKKDEYLTYDFTVAVDGFYDLDVRAATKRDYGSIQVTIDNQSYTVAIPNTGGWETWQDVIIPNVVLNAGTTTMRVDMKSPGLNLDFFELDPLEEILVI